MVGKLEEDKLLEMKCITSHKSSGGTKTSCEASGTVESSTTESFPKEATSTSDLTAELLRSPTQKEGSCFHPAKENSVAASLSATSLSTLVTTSSTMQTRNN